MAKSLIKVPRFVNSTVGRVLIAHALTVAIAAFAYRNADPGTRERLRGKFRKGTDGARELMSRSTARLSFAFGEAVTAFRTALDRPHEGFEDGTDSGVGNAMKNKKQHWSSSEPEIPAAS